MRKFLFLSSLLMSLCVSAQAQWQRTPTPNDTLQSVRVLPNGDAVFCIYAPKARTVSLMGDIVPWDKPLDVKESKDGVWSIVVPKPVAGVYRYHFVVDGVQVYDPKSETTTQGSAVANVTPNGETFYSYRKDIPHGAIAVRKYESKTIGETRTMRVWTPAGYEKSSEKLPVLYLIHGGGDTDTSWPSVGCAGDILDNLLAEGKMKPMIVVMPNGTIQTEDMMGEVPIFAKDMVTDIIPFIENNYRVLTDKKNRAIAGLSMGGMETLEVALNNIDMFSYVWVLSSSFSPGNKAVYDYEREHLKQIADKVNKSFKILCFTQGGPTDIAYNNCKQTLELFDGAKIKYEYNEVSGGHSWEAWRQNLFDLAPRLFK
ncbi:MAG: endo-1,4-beta-xylanase Z [Bacteroidales bacterium]|nr:endo-1,4-beta-xylanase Z [Bacteroidales bacterium]